MRLCRALLLVALIASLLVPLSGTVQAARGIPGSPEFGYGASLSLENPYLDQALYLGNALRLDWVAIDIAWEKIEPENGNLSGLATLDAVMNSLGSTRSPVLLRLTQAPAWALTAQGPDPALTARLMTTLLDRYAGVAQAIEVFPGANTLAGWRAAPNPADYALLFQSLKAALQGRPAWLVAGGLRPLAAGSTDGWDDLAFLQGLYDAGLRDAMPVLSLELADLQGDPLTPPSGDARVLRHYEQVRQVMVNNDHANGMIWVTRIQLASGTIGMNGLGQPDPNQQAQWLYQAATQIRSQLYIGMTIFASLNPATPGTAALIDANGEFHPFHPLLKSFIDQNHPSTEKGKPGRPKDIALIKTKT
jgi:hypothetical protein